MALGNDFRNDLYMPAVTHLETGQLVCSSYIGWASLQLASGSLYFLSSLAPSSGARFGSSGRVTPNCLGYLAHGLSSSTPDRDHCSFAVGHGAYPVV